MPTLDELIAADKATRVEPRPPKAGAPDSALTVLDRMIAQEKAKRNASTPDPAEAGLPSLLRNIFGQSGAADAVKGTSGGTAAFGNSAAEQAPVVGPLTDALASRAEAGIKSIGKGTPYADELSGVQGRTADMEGAEWDRHPGASMGGAAFGMGAGSLPLGLLGRTGDVAESAFGRLAGRAPAAQRVAPGALTPGSTMSPTGKLLSGAAVGAGVGGADAGLRTGHWWDAVEGAGLGGIIGAGAPVAMRGITAAGQGVADSLARLGPLRGQGVSPANAQKLTEALMGDNALGQGGLDAVRRSPNGTGMVADAGRNSTNLLDYSLVKGGPGTRDALNAVEDRASAAQPHITAALDQHLGATRSLAEAEEALRVNSRTPLRNAYDTAYATAIPYHAQGVLGGSQAPVAGVMTPEAQQLMGTLQRVPHDVWERANKLMRLEGEQSQQFTPTLNADGSVSFNRLPDVRQLDYVTRALNDVGYAGDGKGALGGKTHEGRAYSRLSGDIRGQLRAMVPEYGQALDLGSDAISARNAMQLGHDAMSGALDAGELRVNMKNMSTAERDWVAQGQRAWLEQKMSKVKAVLTDDNVDAREARAAVNELSSRDARAKLEASVGPQRAHQLYSQIDQVLPALQLRAGISTNSKTAQRTMLDAVDKEAAEPGAIAHLTGGHPVLAARALLQKATGNTPQARLTAALARNGELAGAATRQGPQAESLIQALARSHGLRGTINPLFDQASSFVMPSVPSASRALKRPTDKYLLQQDQQ